LTLLRSHNRRQRELLTLLHDHTPGKCRFLFFLI
jgi:hypothetical protein